MRIAGIDIPDNKRGEIALTYIYGLGRSASQRVLSEAGIDFNKKVSEWTEEESNKIRNIISTNFKIEGDLKSQQAIRFNIFQLYQTYTGNNAKLNIGPKGFTGEKYGGATYWDTEAFCLPFFLKTSLK